MIPNNAISPYEYETIRVILKDSKLIKNVEYTSRHFKIDHTRLCGIINEFEESGCVILQSKINHGKH